MSRVMRAALWGGLILGVVLCSAVCKAADTTRLDVSGTLIKPPCTADFPSTQSVEVPKVNLNSLQSGITEWTDLTFDFHCTKGSTVQVRFTAGNGTYDPATLRTTLDKLGLNTRLSDVTSTARAIDMNLGERLTFAVPDTALNLKLSVRPVKTGEQLPVIGTYSATLLMEVVYL
ncbi:hypothetical protein C4J96_3356 [Pseudomonas orientalis]|nr:hypothetical protein C4J96_3356 [Pseudomonas orientalis]